PVRPEAIHGRRARATGTPGLGTTVPRRAGIGRMNARFISGLAIDPRRVTELDDPTTSEENTGAGSNYPWRGDDPARTAQWASRFPMGTPWHASCSTIARTKVRWPRTRTSFPRSRSAASRGPNG